jgi:hypothetical protein
MDWRCLWTDPKVPWMDWRCLWTDPKVPWIGWRCQWTDPNFPWIDSELPGSRWPAIGLLRSASWLCLRGFSTARTGGSQAREGFSHLARASVFARSESIWFGRSRPHQIARPCASLLRAFADARGSASRARSEGVGHLAWAWVFARSESIWFGRSRPHQIARPCASLLRAFADARGSASRARSDGFMHLACAWGFASSQSIWFGRSRPHQIARPCASLLRAFADARGSASRARQLTPNPRRANLTVRRRVLLRSRGSSRVCAWWWCPCRRCRRSFPCSCQWRCVRRSGFP